VEWVLPSGDMVAQSDRSATAAGGCAPPSIMRFATLQKLFNFAQ
jgi:hypothetical protein